MRRRWMLAPLAPALGCSLLAAAAAAQDVQSIKLADGSVVTGEVVEYVAGDHVTVKLADGDTRRIQWRNLASPAHAPRVDAAPSASAAAPAPAPSSGATAPSAPLPLLPAPSPLEPTGPEPAAAPAPAESFSGALEWSPRLGELRPAVGVERDSGWSPQLSLGVQGGWASPFGYLSLVADYFPWLWPALRGVGFELTVAMPVADEPVTLGETLLLGFDIGIVQLGFGAGLAQSFTREIIPGDHPGLTTLFTADLSHVGIEITRELWIRARWGMAFFLSGDYCTTHPEACPQLSNFVPFYGDATVGWTFDFAGSGKPAGAR
jgi:hypothetical protein